MSKYPIPNTIGDVVECIRNIRTKPMSQSEPVMDAVEQGLCPLCMRKVTGFTDDLSMREYKISGMCQECQDEFFDSQEE